MFILFLIALAWYLYAATRGLRQNIYSDGLCTFCQAQRAMGIWSILKFGRHELPALGPGGDGGDDWRVPFEFPLYQWMSAKASHLLSRLKRCDPVLWEADDMEPAARLVGIFSYLAVVAAAIVAGPAIGLGGETRWILPALLAVSPLYVAWSRTIMIETTALACNAWYLAAVILAMHHSSPWWCIAAIVFGALGAMVKVNAASICWLAGFAAAAGMSTWHPWAFWALATWPAVMSGMIWTASCDRIKSKHPISRLTQLSTLPVQRRWMFGTWRQKFSAATWGTILGRERRFSALGLLPCLILCLVVHAWAGVVCLGVYLAAPAIWTNAVLVHEDGHYHIAFGIFLLAAVALAIGASGFCLLPTALCLLFCAFVWWREYRPRQLNDLRHLDATAGELARRCPAEGVLVIVGQDWSPELAYLARRRALYVPDWPELTAGDVSVAVRNVGRSRRPMLFIAFRDARKVAADFVENELKWVGIDRRLGASA